ncbi:hypothetical protein ISF_03997 [Cordyceps fumosorosea ARSEF 2679]|uniref:Endosomal SPRY domain protein n=1 Tax=Cordyceps fumosorosea (strain ARSEF 2679) TaxID=1081104 RepID=A0A167YCE7_CORFA|nr:hypothetical protein ISF_03997 [Cordyceps fumosorosea ARSEF 2679]OAA66159.1 hypothetical protein ISF_03997 [Cordyceps fumosorosea ARSEF 2679]
MAPVLTPLLRRAFAAISAAPVPSATISNDGALDGPLGDATRMHAARDTATPNPTHDPSSGVLDPHDISNAGFFALFALLGVAFVVAGIWFFFWARNGGFHFKENDWEDYKTAVLRRRGPNGTLLSGATESTDLGGGSVYKDVAEDDGRTTITDSTGLSGITAGASDIAAREKREEKRRKRQKEREQRKKSKNQSEVSGDGEYDEKKNKRRVGGDGEVQDEEAEMKARDELRNYRHEKAARVGGLNKETEGSSWDGSNPTTSHTGTESELLPNKQSTPTNTPTKDKKRGGIRKVYSTADRNADREARRMRDDGRTHRRDFSFQRAEPTDSLLSGQAGSSDVTGSQQSSDLGTKSYHHPRPEIARAQREREREERRVRRGGYRRGRGDDEL